MNWQHPVVDEPTFTAPWTALKNAIDLATVIGESPALRTDLVYFGKPKRCRPKVSFCSEMQLVLEFEDANIALDRQVSLDDFSQWTCKPWSLAEHDDPDDNDIYHLENIQGQGQGESRARAPTGEQLGRRGGQGQGESRARAPTGEQLGRRGDGGENRSGDLVDPLSLAVLISEPSHAFDDANAPDENALMQKAHPIVKYRDAAPALEWNQVTARQTGTDGAAHFDFPHAGIHQPHEGRHDDPDR